MNLQLHHVVSDITGTTGMRIIRAIVGSERAPEALAAFRDALGDICHYFDPTQCRNFFKAAGYEAD